MFPAADNLEQNLIAIITSTCGEGTAEAYLKKLNLYKVRVCFSISFGWIYSLKKIRNGIVVIDIPSV